MTGRERLGIGGLSQGHLSGELSPSGATMATADVIDLAFSQPSPD